MAQRLQTPRGRADEESRTEAFQGVACDMELEQLLFDGEQETIILNVSEEERAGNVLTVGGIELDDDLGEVEVVRIPEELEVNTDKIEDVIVMFKEIVSGILDDREDIQYIIDGLELRELVESELREAIGCVSEELDLESDEMKRIFEMLEQLLNKRLLILTIPESTRRFMIRKLMSRINSKNSELLMQRDMVSIRICEIMIKSLGHEALEEARERKQKLESVLALLWGLGYTAAVIAIVCRIVMCCDVAKY